MKKVELKFIGTDDEKSLEGLFSKRLSTRILVRFRLIWKLLRGRLKILTMTWEDYASD